MIPLQTGGFVGIGTWIDLALKTPSPRRSRRSEARVSEGRHLLREVHGLQLTSKGSLGNLAGTSSSKSARFRLPVSPRPSTPVLPLLDSRSTKRLQKDRRRLCGLQAF